MPKDEREDEGEIVMWKIGELKSKAQPRKKKTHLAGTFKGRSLCIATPH